MPRSDPPNQGDEPRRESIAQNEAVMANRVAGQVAPPDLIDSWDPADDQTGPEPHRPAQWDWHAYPTWGRRAIAAFPVVAVVLAIALFTIATVSAQGAIAQVQSVTGSGGATLLARLPQGSTGGVGPGGDPAAYRDVSFQVPGLATLPIEGSTSLALPNYPGWVANGSAGPANGLATVGGGLLHVGVRRPTPDFRGWFLTATSPTPATCAFQFSAASPPPVTSTNGGAVGELVMAVQTSNTVTTGDINYVLVAETVTSDGRRNLIVGYALGHLSHAVAHVLKETPWFAGPLQVAIETNGNDSLSVWVNGQPFYAATDLQMGIKPPFEPYLEVQARGTAYSVAYDGYSSACQNDLAISDLPDGSTARLGTTTVAAHDGVAAFPLSQIAPPVTGELTLSLPGSAEPVRFSRHRYWPGDRFSFEPGA